MGGLDVHSTYMYVLHSTYILPFSSLLSKSANLNGPYFAKRQFQVVVEPLVYFAFLFFNETVITKTQGLVVAIAKRKYIN